MPTIDLEARAGRRAQVLRFGSRRIGVNVESSGINMGSHVKEINAFSLQLDLSEESKTTEQALGRICSKPSPTLSPRRELGPPSQLDEERSNPGRTRGMWHPQH